MSIEVCNGIKSTEPIILTDGSETVLTKPSNIVPVSNTENDVNTIANLQQLIDSSKINLNGAIII
jgi:hypothetical protein